MPTEFTRFLLLLAAAGQVLADVPRAVDETDFYSELPVVLTVSRLAQPQSETPGAVTVLDRETIRRSGARDVADLMRLVPGYIVSGWNGANPLAVYHSALDNYGIRNQVLIDGRSVYSSFYFGDTHRGMMGVVMDDIERIEVLRGSNSASYGANAFLGVINIVTRHAADTHGTLVSVTQGDQGVNDNVLRHGWGGENAHFRLSTMRQTDHGYRNAHDDKAISQLHFRGDLRPAQDSDLMLTAGVIRESAGEGFPGNAGNPLRTVRWENYYLNAGWRKTVAENEELSVRASIDIEDAKDRTDYALIPGVVLDFGGRGERYSVEWQDTQTLDSQLRVMWGGSVKHEVAKSTPLYYVPKVAFNRYQLFGNVEWRPHERWIINAGGLWEKHSISGSEFAPRLAANFQLAPGHTLRAGVTRAFRSPSLFELRSDVRYSNGARTVLARGNARAESIDSNEIGYLAEIKAARLTLDVRVFNERLRDIVRKNDYVLPGVGTVSDYMNHQGPKFRGIEYQARWRPADGTEIWLNQAVMTAMANDRMQYVMAVPRHITTLALFQRFDSGLDVTAMLHAVDTMSWRKIPEDVTNHGHRLDLRFAWPFRIGSTRAEAAVTVQAANSGYPVFQPSQQFEFDRRTFGTLRLEF